MRIDPLASDQTDEVSCTDSQENAVPFPLILQTPEPNRQEISATFHVAPAVGQRVSFMTKDGIGSGIVRDLEHRQGNDGAFRLHVILE